MERIKLLILNGQSWKGGQFLRIDANGYLKPVATDGTQITHYALSDQADPVSTTTYAEVGVVTAEQEYEANLLSQRGPATIVGGKYALNVASNIVTVDLTDPTNVAVQITDVGQLFSPAEYDATDTKQRVRFKVLTTVIEAARAA